MSAALLEVDGLSVQFGGLRAVDGVSFTVDKSEIVGLIGPNGAGKTTIFNCISGVLTPTGGDVRIGGRTTRGLKPEQVCALGVTRTFQNVRLFGDLSLRENVMMGAYSAGGCGMLSAMLRLPGHHRLERLAGDRAEFWMERLGLSRFRDAPATSLPLGLQRVAEVARAMAAEPKVVLLDEPAAGLNAVEKRRLADILRAIAGDGECALLIVDHDMTLMMGLVQRLEVVDFGRRIAAGTPAEIAVDAKVIKAYLGAG